MVKPDPEMTLIYNDRRAGHQLDDTSISYTREQVVALIRQLQHVDASLITTLPSGAGLDFTVHGDGTIWIEFYADDGLHSATVSLAAAEQIFERAYSLPEMPHTKECFADLIEEWDY